MTALPPPPTVAEMITDLRSRANRRLNSSAPQDRQKSDRHTILADTLEGMTQLLSEAAAHMERKARYTYADRAVWRNEMKYYRRDMELPDRIRALLDKPTPEQKT